MSNNMGQNFSIQNTGIINSTNRKYANEQNMLEKAGQKPAMELRKDY